MLLPATVQRLATQIRDYQMVSSQEQADESVGGGIEWRCAGGASVGLRDPLLIGAMIASPLFTGSYVGPVHYKYRDKYRASAFRRAELAVSRA